MYVCWIMLEKKELLFSSQILFWTQKLFSSDSNDFFGNVIYIYVIAYANFQ